MSINTDTILKPVVTIITPAYNAEAFIIDTIKSVLAQTYTNWQWFLINDGSTDRTEACIQSYTSDSRIHYFKHSNCGVASTRNRGIEMANTKYIAFLDADDVWLPNNLKHKIDALEAQPDIDWVYSNMYELHTGTNTLKKANPGTDSEITRNILLWQGQVVPGPCSNIVVKKNCLGNNIRFDKNLSTAADQDFCLQLSFFKAKLLADYLWQYRIIGTSMSRNISIMEKDHIYVFKKAESRKLYSGILFKRRCFANLYLILAGSWWVNGNNKKRGAVFMLKAIATYPPVIIRLFKKLIP